ncbi:MAG: thioesterase family protein [Acidobacteriota bacterium]|nr:thioesterase family protein [Acidobacteriota bacterium]
MSTIGETTLRVRYAETDAMAVVYNANYITYFEVGRVDLLRDLGFSYLQMEQDGFNLPVVEVRCRFKHPARYDDEIVIRTRLAQMRPTFLHFVYELIRKSDGRLLAEGESLHVVVNREGNKAPLTGKYLEAIREAADKKPLAAPAQ